MDAVTAFMDLTKNMASPPLFRLWSAIAMVSSTASRRVWTCIEDDLPLYPNIFVWLVSQPGIGKSRPMDLVARLLTKLRHVARTGDEVTREQLVMHLSETFTEDSPDGFWSFVINVSEIATFLAKPDTNWLQALARMWDCPDTYSRLLKHEKVKEWAFNIYVTMLVGAQPAWFITGFPHHAYDMGLPARIHFIYADKKPDREFFRPLRQATDLGPLVERLEFIGTTAVGEFVWADDAKAAWREWADKGMPPAPIDTLLRGYTTRRDMHAGKLALISAISAHPHKPVIMLRDLQRAWDWLFEAEKGAPKALAAAGGNAFNIAQEAILEFARQRIALTGAPVEERILRRQLNKMVPAHLVENIIEEMVVQERLAVLPSSLAPLRRFKLGKEAQT